MEKVKTDIHEIQSELVEWLDDVLPERTLESSWIKLEQELAELRKVPTDSAEWADTFIILLDLVDLYGINISKAIHHKHKVNKNRKWKIEKDGTMNHE